MHRELLDNGEEVESDLRGESASLPYYNVDGVFFLVTARVSLYLVPFTKFSHV